MPNLASCRWHYFLSGSTRALSAVKKILLLESVSQIGGAEKVLLQILQGLDRDRFQPITVVLARPGEFSREAAHFAPVYHYPIGRYRYVYRLVQRILQLALFVRSERIALIHSNGTKAHIIGGLVAKLAGVPCVWRLTDLPDLSNSLTKLARRIPAQAYTANSSFHAGRWVQVGLDSRRMVTLFSSTVRQDSLLESGRPSLDPQSLRQELALPASALVTTMVGRVQRWKGQHVFLTSAHRVLEEIPDAYFLVVGDALFGLDLEYRDELTDLVTRLGIADRVRFTGWRRDVPEILAASDIVVHASVLPEPWGNVLVEAMAAGKPVIASDAGGPREIVVPGGTGLLVPPGDAEAMAQAIIALARDPARREALGMGGRERVLNHFTAEVMTEHVQKIWERLAESSSIGSEPHP